MPARRAAIRRWKSPSNSLPVFVVRGRLARRVLSPLPLLLLLSRHPHFCVRLHSHVAEREGYVPGFIGDSHVHLIQTHKHRRETCIADLGGLAAEFHSRGYNRCVGLERACLAGYHIV